MRGVSFFPPPPPPRCARSPPPSSPLPSLLPRTVDLDLVRVHGRVGHQDARVLHARRLAHAGRLGQDEALIQPRLGQRAARLLEDVDGRQVGGALQPQHSVHGQGGKVVAVARQDFRGERGARYADEVGLKRRRVAAPVDRPALQGVRRHARRGAVARHDGHGVHPRADERFRAAEELAREDDDGRRAIACRLVLDAGQVDEDLGRRVVDVQGAQDGGAVVGDGHAPAAGDGLQDFVLERKRGGEREREWGEG